jgi:hypothetical protein
MRGGEWGVSMDLWINVSVNEVCMRVCMCWGPFVHCSVVSFTASGSTILHRTVLNCTLLHSAQLTLLSCFFPFIPLFLYAIQYNTLDVQTVQYSTVQYSTEQNRTGQSSTVQLSTSQYNVVQYSTIKCNIAKYSTAQFSTALHSKMQCIAVQCSTVKLSVHTTVRYVQMQSRQKDEADEQKSKEEEEFR